MHSTMEPKYEELDLKIRMAELLSSVTEPLISGKEKDVAAQLFFIRLEVGGKESSFAWYNINPV